jgi:hypothetical protein
MRKVYPRVGEAAVGGKIAFCRLIDRPARFRLRCCLWVRQAGATPGAFVSGRHVKDVFMKFRSLGVAAFGLFALTAGAFAQGGFVRGWGDPDVAVPPASTGYVSNVIAGGSFATVLRISDDPMRGGVVFAWGSNTRGECNVPADVDQVAQVACGYFHTVALKTDGTVRSWGFNDFGQCNVPAGLPGVGQVAAGDRHTLALMLDSTVRAWGWNGSGECDVPAGLTAVARVASGVTARTSAAIKMDGTLFVWGDTFDGQGNLPANLGAVTQVAAGYRHMLAIRRDGGVLGTGSVVGWGFNYYDQCTPPANLGPVSQIAAGYNHSVALKVDGTVACWGSNNFGQTNVPAGLETASQISASGNGSLALTGLHALITPSVGPLAGGTRITIVSQGQLFTAPVTVTVGGQPATGVRLESSGFVSATTPAGEAGEAKVVVQCGGRSYEAESFQYATACQADLDGDGEVTGGDLSLLLLQFGPCQ